MKTREEIIETILDYEQELKAQYEECRDTFGILDEDTQIAFSHWAVIDDLLTKLNLEPREL